MIQPKPLLLALFVAALAANGDTVTILLVGDINISQRADPTTAFANVLQQLKSADLVYGNLEGLLIKSQGPDRDIPDKSGLPMPADMLAETRPLSASPRPDDPSLFAPIPLGPRFMQAEPYEKLLAHAAIDAGADIVYGHGSHVVQGVEVYKGKPVMYCLGNFATDWIRMRPNKDGLVARVTVEGKKVARVSLTPVTRDPESNNVRLLDAAAGEGAALLKKVRELSGETGLFVAGEEAVLIPGSKP